MKAPDWAALITAIVALIGAVTAYIKSRTAVKAAAKK